MTIPMEYTSFGYRFLQRTSTGALHSGVDLNFGQGSADLGKEVVAMADGEVVHAAATGGGWGNMVIIFHRQLAVWTRYAHLNEIFVNVGDFVEEARQIGTCGKTGGKTGGNWGPHLHFDVILRELDSWSNYTGGMSAARVQEIYTDPLAFIEQHTGDEREHRNLNDNFLTPEFMEEWKKEAQDWAISVGITDGSDPDRPMTRAEMWATLMRFSARFERKAVRR